MHYLLVLDGSPTEQREMESHGSFNLHFQNGLGVYKDGKGGTRVCNGDNKSKAHFFSFTCEPRFKHSHPTSPPHRHTMKADLTVWKNGDS